MRATPTKARGRRAGARVSSAPRRVPVERPKPRRGEPKTRLKIVSLYTPLRLELLRLVRENPGISARRLAMLVGREQARVRDAMYRLREARLVYWVKGSWRNYYYLNGVKPDPTHMEVHPLTGFCGGDTQVGVHTQRVYAYLVERPDSLRHEMMRELRLTRHQAARALWQLEKRGIVRVQRRVTVAKLVRPASEQELVYLAPGVASRR